MAGCIISVRHSCTYLLTYLLTYLHSWLGRMKLAISPKRLKIEWKLLLMAYIKSYTDFWLPPKCVTLNDHWARFKVIDSLNAAQMVKYSLVMTRTPCRVAGCIISVRHSCSYLLTYLLTYFHSWLGHMKPAVSPKRLNRVKATINGLYKVVHWLSIAAKMYDLEWPMSEIQGHWFLKLNAAKVAKYKTQLSRPTDFNNM